MRPAWKVEKGSGQMSAVDELDKVIEQYRRRALGEFMRGHHEPAEASGAKPTDAQSPQL
jgi:hypothetical protein